MRVPGSAEPVRIAVPRGHEQDVKKLRNRFCSRDGYGLRIGSGVAALSTIVELAGEDLRSVGLEALDLQPSLDPMNVEALLRMLNAKLRDSVRQAAEAERTSDFDSTAARPTAHHTICCCSSSWPSMLFCRRSAVTSVCWNVWRVHLQPSTLSAHGGATA